MGMDQYIDTIFSGMNIHLPAILGFTRYQGFDPSPYGLVCFNMVFIGFKMVLICLNGEHEFPTHPGFFLGPNFGVNARSVHEACQPLMACLGKS